MSSWAETLNAVRTRAKDRCEYCRMHQALQGGTFHVEHILPQSRGGVLELANLAWSCPGCNLRKSDRVEAVDFVSGATVPLFNPRTNAWADHFRWDGYVIIGRTAVGRATILVLELNQPRRILIRHAEELFELFPA